MNEDKNTNVIDIINNDPNLKPVSDIVNAIMSIPEESITSDNMEVLKSMFTAAFTKDIKEQSIAGLLKNFKERGYSNVQAYQVIEQAKTGLQMIISSVDASENKKILLKSIFEGIEEIFDEAYSRYISYDIILPVTLDKDAQVPTYAHITDAAADLYAPETVTLPAHSTSNLISTGVHIALPTGWVAYVVPRSSIGAKTGLRLSNSVGVIDSDYRGAVGVIYDNISDSDYTINAGDRIAQLIIMPSYHFKANVVDILPASERGEGGFGSTGK